MSSRAWNPKRLWPLTLAACLTSTACTGEMESAGEGTLGDSALALEVDAALTVDAHAEVTAVRAEGACRDLRPGPHDIAGELDLSGSSDLVGETCRISVDLTVPQGYQLSLPAVEVKVEQPETNTNGAFIARQRYVGGFSSARAELRAGPDQPTSWQPSGNRYVRTPTCSRSTVRYELELSQRALPFAAVDRVILKFRYDAGVDLFRCGRGAVVPPPSKQNEICGGPQNHACTGELVCDRRQFELDPNMLGRCVDPSLPGETSVLGEECGGPQRRPCKDNLSCVYVAKELAGDVRVYGQCLETPSREGFPCGGHADVGCAEGLVCWRSEPNAGAPFGSCERARSDNAGAVCGGTPIIPCGEGLSCAGGSCLRADGEVGARCGPDTAACRAGLTCFHAACADWSSFAEVGEGERCGPSVSRRCASGLTCDNFAKCVKAQP